MFVWHIPAAAGFSCQSKHRADCTKLEAAPGDGWSKPCNAMDGVAEPTWMYLRRVCVIHIPVLQTPSPCRCQPYNCTGFTAVVGAGGAGLCRQGWRHQAYRDVFTATLRSPHPSNRKTPKLLHTTKGKHHEHNQPPTRTSPAL